MLKKIVPLPALASLIAILFLVPACKRNPGNPAEPRIAYITNGVASFWSIAKAGAEAAGRDLKVNVSVHMPAEGINDQKRIVEDLLIRGVDAVAISLIDAANQSGFVNEIASRTTLITHDADAPESNRLAYVGMDNYLAGRMLGKLVRQNMPAGGKIALFVGRVEQDNARKRRQGTIDEILGRDSDPKRFDPVGGTLSGNGFTIVNTLTDQFDRVKAKANCEDILLQHADLDGMVGLFVYNAPACLEALKQSGKVGTIKLFSFDEADETLKAIAEGTMVGTVVQNPYEYGYQSVKLLKEILSGNTAAIPPGKFIDIPARTIDKSNVADFSRELQEKLKKQ